MLEKKLKAKIISKFKTHEGDTGSSQVQIAILTEEVKQLTKHLKDHKNDFSSRRGLLRKVAERRKLLNYLYWEDQPAFEKLAEALKLKVVKPSKGGPTVAELAALAAADEGHGTEAEATTEATA
ncbi:MAG: small subunit ribosomal protein S15 [Parcubacteria group bacterium Gr01-1014_31]|nr:MAG: small subunit ribosomal protein S15 [Parcubacteria group bacterium Gr01-1014_31]